MSLNRTLLVGKSDYANYVKSKFLRKGQHKSKVD